MSYKVEKEPWIIFSPRLLPILEVPTSSKVCLIIEVKYLEEIIKIDNQECYYCTNKEYKIMSCQGTHGKLTTRM